MDRHTLLQWGAKAGLHHIRFLDRSDASGLIPNAVRFNTLLVAGLSCFVDESADDSRKGVPHGLIAPFARRNYYREAVHRLRQLAYQIRDREKLSLEGFRIFCNSRLPEKTIAYRSGLGFYGKNSLMINPSLGSLFVIGVLTLPFAIGSDPPLETVPGRSCGDCRACMSHCPVQAISSPGTIDVTRCLQALSTSTKVLPEAVKEAWGFRIYGCQSCQDVCPFNGGLSHEMMSARGVLGPSIPLEDILVSDLTILNRRLSGTALGMNWIPAEAIRRNALLAAGHRRDPAVLPAIESFSKHPEPFLADAASWAERRIRGSLAAGRSGFPG